jgi:hypothetical protein
VVVLSPGQKLALRIWKGGDTPWSRAIDLVVVTGVVLGLSVIFDRSESGWIATNPSPFLLCPMLLGARYGLISGLFAAVVGGAIVVGQSAWSLGTTWEEVAASGLYTVTAFPVVGILAGEVQAYFWRSMRRAETQAGHMAARLRVLDEEAFILRESKDELDRALALMDADVATLDFEIRRLLQMPREKVPRGLLGILGRKARIQEAAMYVPAAKGAWTRVAAIGRGDRAPEAIVPGRSVVFDRALAEGAMVSLPQVWGEEPEQGDDFLFAFPLRDVDGATRAMLLVADIPFIALNRRTLLTVEIICRWASAFLGLMSGDDTRRPGTSVETTVFLDTLRLAWDAWKILQITSSLIVLRGGSGASLTDDEVDAAVAGTVRSGDFLARLDVARPHRVLLLPMTGERGAELCVGRIRAHAEAKGFGNLRIDVLRMDTEKSFEGCLEHTRSLLDE